MARNKRLQDREEKREEIMAAARILFLQEGYEATAMNRLAIAAGVAPNTIYWYFKDKDELLVAILNAELAERFNEYIQQPMQDPAERLLWVVNQLQLTNRLVSTVHSRLQVSPEINSWHERFHLLVESLLRLELQQAGIAGERIETLVKIAIFTVEGLLAHQLPEAEKRAICAALVNPLQIEKALN
jgi:AcrR family transcriptional regulator